MVIAIVILQALAACAGSFAAGAVWSTDRRDGLALAHMSINLLVAAFSIAAIVLRVASLLPAEVRP